LKSIRQRLRCCPHSGERALLRPHGASGSCPSDDAKPTNLNLHKGDNQMKARLIKANEADTLVSADRPKNLTIANIRQQVYTKTHTRDGQAKSAAMQKQAARQLFESLFVK